MKTARNGMYAVPMVKGRVKMRACYIACNTGPVF